MKRVHSRITSMVLSLVMILGLATNSALAAGQSHLRNILETESTQDTVRAAYIPKVGFESSNLKTNELDAGMNEIEIADFTHNYANNEFVFTGTINNNSFNVSAEPYSSPANENVQVYNGTDNLGNYDVLYVALEQNISGSVMYFADSREQHDYIIKLYMRTAGSDDIIIVETFSNSSAYVRPMTYATMTAGDAENSEGVINQFWYAKVFKPVEVYQAGNEPRYMQNRENAGDYTYSYNHLGATYNQVFRLWRHINWPNSIDNQEAFTTTLRVAEEYTNVSGYPNENSNQTNMRVDSVQIDVAVDEGDAIETMQFAGKTHKAGTPKIQLKLNTGLNLYGRLSIATSYEKANSDYKLNATTEKYNNTTYAALRQAKSELEAGYRLEDTGHYYATTWNIQNVSGAKTGQVFQVKFTYTMRNLMDYAHWVNGTKTFTDSVTYNTTK